MTECFFHPSQPDALRNLQNFKPHMGRAYAARRNYDLGVGAHKHVSQLSPYVRHRVVSEHSLVEAALRSHGYQAAEKFIQEVFWRTYWKGWLERRPEIWRRYQIQVNDLHRALDNNAAQLTEFRKATSGQTGIDCFDAWVEELVTTGYLHNHARMWFASIWVFTLGLPWQLGADFFLKNLLDGDAASNTLSWRWVAGLQTKGKTYLARPDNIERYTEGRFYPANQLAGYAAPLDDEIPPAADSPITDPIPDGPLTLVVTDDHLDPIPYISPAANVRRVIVLDSVSDRTPNGVSTPVQTFVSGLYADMRDRLRGDNIDMYILSGDAINSVADYALPETELAALYAPLGAGRDKLDRAIKATPRNIPRILPVWDKACFQHCKKGFFVFKKEIPNLISKLLG